jgi:hypothetical protein
MEYSSTKEIILKTGVLSDEDTAFINNNIGEIQNNWEKRQVFRTETEMRISVLNDTKFPTPASKYWQAIREQAVFYENLVALSFDYRRNQIKQEKIQRKIDKCEDDLKRRSLAIDMEEAKFRQINMEQVAKERMREIRLWSQIMEECQQADNFDTENVDTHQFISYLARWHQQYKELDKSNSSVSEVNNLLGQYVTALKVAHERQILLPADMRKEAQKLGAPVFTEETKKLEDKVSTLGSVSFDLNGITAGIRGS